MKKKYKCSNPMCECEFYLSDADYVLTYKSPDTRYEEDEYEPVCPGCGGFDFSPINDED